METISTEKINLFDGDESLYYNKEMQISISQISEAKFNTNVFNLKNELGRLEPIIGHSEFLNFIRSNNFKGPVGVIPEYLGKFDLSLYFLRFEEYIVVFAAGEKQPTRFMIYLEGIWKLTAHTL